MTKRILPLDKRDIDRERRKQRRLESMGTNNPVCISCGWTEWYSFHGHHIAGRRFDKHFEYFCERCHGGFTEDQKSFPKPTSDKPGQVECAGHYCLGVALILIPAARMLEEFGHSLIRSDNAQSDHSEQSLTQKLGHFLIMLAAILGRIAVQLERHGYALVEQAQAAKTSA